MNSPKDDSSPLFSKFEGMHEKGKELMKKVTITTKATILGILTAGGWYYIGQESIRTSDLFYKDTITNFINREDIQNQKTLVEKELNVPVTIIIYWEYGHPENGLLHAFIPTSSANDVYFNTDKIHSINQETLSTNELKIIYDLPGNHNSLYERSVPGFSYNGRVQHDLIIWRTRFDGITDANDWIISDTSSTNKPEQGKYQIVGISFNDTIRTFNYTTKSGVRAILDSE